MGFGGGTVVALSGSVRGAGMSLQRIRTIKPEFFVHEDLAHVSMPGRLLFVGLWTVADREGRLEDRPRRLKAQLFPHDAVDVDLLLDELAERGFIRRYEVAGLTYVDIPAFLKHQRVGNREPPSEIPACLSTLKHAEARARAQGTGTGTGTGTGREQKKLAIARKEKPKFKTAWPDEFALTAELAAYATRQGLDAAYQWGKFKAHALQDDRRHVNWIRAWEYWVRNAWEIERRHG
jgi:hypothetical protein